MKCAECGKRIKGQGKGTLKFGIHGGKPKFYCDECLPNLPLAMSSKLKSAVGFRTKKEKALDKKNNPTVDVPKMIEKVEEKV